MRVGQPRKRDANEPDIVFALEQIGVKVQRVSEKGFCDLICWSERHKQVVLMEVKNVQGKNKLTAAQIEHRKDGWPVCIVRSVAEALALFGITQ